MKKIQMQVVSDFDKLLLDVLWMEPEVELKGILQIAHGMCEHKERYLPFMEYMAAKGYVCIIHDHRGHGGSVKSEDDLGYIYQAGAEGLVADLHQVTLYAKQQWPNLPLILLGHSMGALVVRNYIKIYDSDIDTLIFSACPCKRMGVAPAKAIAGIQQRIHGRKHRSMLLEAITFGGYNLYFPKEKSKFAWTCSNPEVIKEYETSKLCGFTFTADAYQGVLTLLNEGYQSGGWLCNNPNLPILFLAGEEDPCAGSNKKLIQSMKCLKKAGYRHVTGKRYPDMRHEILNEQGKEAVYKNIASYIEKCRKFHLYGQNR